MDFYAQRALQLGADEIARRGQAIYEGRLRQQLDTPDNLGKFLAIDIDSGDYLIGGRLDAAQTLQTQHPDSIIYLLKIGYAAASTRGGRLVPLPK